MNKNLELINNLSWNKSNEIQEDAIGKLSEIDNQDMRLLIMPGTKDLWENAARVIQKIGFPKIKSVILDLFVWLQDMNWPGSEIIKDVLVNIDKEKIVPYLEQAIRTAADKKDYIWIANLKVLVENMKISEVDFKNKEVLELLKLSEW